MSATDAERGEHQRAVDVERTYWLNRRTANWLVVGLCDTTVLVGAVLGFLVAVVAGVGWLAVVLGALVGAGVAWLLAANRWGWLERACSAGGVAAGGSSGLPPQLSNVAEQVCLTLGVAAPNVVVVDAAGVNLAVVARSRQDWTLLLTDGLVRYAATADPAHLEALVAAAATPVSDGSAVVRGAALGTIGLPELAAGATLGPFKPLAALLAVPLRPVLRRALSRPDDFTADSTAAGRTRYPPGLVAAYEAANQAGTAVNANRGTVALWLFDPGSDGRSSAASPARPPLAERIDALNLS